MGIFSFLNRGKKIKELKEQGALIIDVRSTQEFKGGHIAQSKNIPLDRLEQQLKKYPEHQALIFCCASGMRSGMAARMAKGRGFNCTNGGSWQSLRGRL